MTRDPFFNAFLAAGYISGVVLLINYMSRIGHDTPDVLLIPLAMISLFVLSAAVMGYLFVYEPSKLYFDGKRLEAAHFFLKTVATFAAITAVLFVVLIYVYSAIL